MKFFSENPNDEIWENMHYWLTHPVTKAEQNKRDKEINDYINYVIDRKFKD